MQFAANHCVDGCHVGGDRGCDDVMGSVFDSGRQGEPAID
jgi:hypothetical protein